MVRDVLNKIFEHGLMDTPMLLLFLDYLSYVKDFKHIKVQFNQKKLIQYNSIF